MPFPNTSSTFEADFPPKTRKKIASGRIAACSAAYGHPAAVLISRTTRLGSQGTLQ